MKCGRVFAAGCQGLLSLRNKGLHTVSQPGLVRAVGSRHLEGHKTIEGVRQGSNKELALSLSRSESVEGIPRERC